MNKPWKEVTIYDIAEKLHLSASTVSRALNDHPIIKEKTRLLVKATAEKMNFNAGLLRKTTEPSKQRTLGVVLPFLYRDQTAEIVSGIIETANTSGYEVVISQSFGLISQEIELVNTMFSKKVDGLLICLALEKRDMPHLLQFRQNQIPVCSFYKVWNNPYSGQIKINDFKAAYELSCHLIQQGYTRIGYLTHQSVDQMYQDRLLGIKAALHEHQLPYYADWTYKTDLSVEAGEMVGKNIALCDTQPNGLLIDDDLCAAACMNTLRNCGYDVPGNMGIVTFGDTVAAFTEPPLTAINFQRYQMGQFAATQIINQLKYKELHNVRPFKMELGYELIIRRSSVRLGVLAAINAF